MIISPYVRCYNTTNHHQVTFLNFVTALLNGEIRCITVTLSNQGQVPLFKVKLVTSHPHLFVLPEITSKSFVTYVVLLDFKDSNTLGKYIEILQNKDIKNINHNKTVLYFQTLYQITHNACRYTIRYTLILPAS